MGTAYRAVVVVGELEPVRHHFNELTFPLSLQLLRLEMNTFAVVPIEGRWGTEDEDKFLNLARQLSKGLRQSLAVFYDNRCGLRQAMLMRNGELARKFGESDGTFVPLDEQGEPEREAAPLSIDKLDPKGEYECHQSAIDLGLHEMQVDSKVDGSFLKKAICSEECEIVAIK